jgi:biopolymer transport protein ExbB
MAGIGQMIRDGGPIIILLAVLSAISLAVIVWKTIRLLGVIGSRDRRDQALSDWSEGKHDEAKAAASAGTAPADRMLLQAMELVELGHGGAVLEADLARRGNEEVAIMSAGIRFLELIAMIAPLLGLLGTVLGMIQSFQQLAAAEGSANASVLAGGIWQALLTTAAGLLVAIPAAVGASFLGGRVERAGLAIESAVTELLLRSGNRAE